MKFANKLIVSGIMTAVLGGCSTTTTEKTDSPQAGTDNRPEVAVKIDPSKNPETVNKVILPKDENGNVIVDPASNTNVNAMVERRSSKLEAMRKAAESGPVKFDEPALLKKAARPAPENSEFAVILTNAAVEVRTFRDHPQIVKVEKRSSGGESVLKIFLRDGKVISLPGESIPELATESSAKIIEVSGINNGPKGGSL